MLVYGVLHVPEIRLCRECRYLLYVLRLKDYFIELHYFIYRNVFFTSSVPVLMQVNYILINLLPVYND